MPSRRAAAMLVLPLAALGACHGDRPNPRGVGRDETLLSVSATGRAENRPDEARFSVGVESYRGAAGAASAANREATTRLLAALAQAGVAEKDTRTQTVSVQRMDYGPRRGQFQAVNQVEVRVRDIDKAGTIVAVATNAGANVLSGPSLGISDPEKASLSAYGAAYRAARARADAYAAAAGMRVSRILAIRDGGAGGTPRPYDYEMADRVAPAPVVAQAAPIRAGLTTSEVGVQVDFALTAN